VLEVAFGLDLVGFEHEGDDEEEDKNDPEQTDIPEESQCENLVV
jgi:hypothetical protein